MRERILNEDFLVESGQKGGRDVFGFRFDWKQAIDAKNNALKKWTAIQSAGTYKSLDDFLEAEEIPNLADSDFLKEKNTYWMAEEISERVKDGEYLKYLFVDELYHENSLLELLANAENVEHIQGLYKVRKRNVKGSGLKAEEAAKIRNCIRQGTELFNAGRSGALMVKPLNFFYSLTAYSYAIVLLNNPLRYSLETLPGSHGVNYLPDRFSVQFGGDAGRGTFTELFAAFPTNYIKSHSVFFHQTNFESIKNLFENKVTVSVGTLLSMVPEIRDYYALVTGRNSRAHPLDIGMAHDNHGAKYRFQIGDGITQPAVGQVEQAFEGMAVREVYGKKEVDVPISSSGAVKALIYVDVRGRFWFVENPIFPLVLPEVCLHFLISNIFSNVMRYSPDTWGAVLFNDVDTDVSLIIRKYLSALESKMAMLSLRSISKYFPYIGS